MTKEIRVNLAQTDHVTQHKTVVLSVPDNVELDNLFDVIKEDIDQFFMDPTDNFFALDETNGVEVVSSIQGEDHWAGETETWVVDSSEVVLTANS